MPRTTDEITLASPSPGTRRFLKLHRYGEPGARPKAYLHAALHADEWPGLLTLNHLTGLLDAADAEGRIAGEIVLLPYANPIGMAQRINGNHPGRFEFDGGGNFNRHWPDLTETIAEALDGKLSSDATENGDRVRDALKAAAGDLPRRTELEILKATLLSLSVDADLVLDVHCDSISAMHLYANRVHADIVMELARDLASPVVLLEDEPGGDPFDSANAGPWIRLRQRIGDDYPIPDGCFATTVELRGRNDVDDGLAAKDAKALFNFLQRRGVVGGNPEPLPEVPCEPTPLDGVDVLRAPAAGIVAWKSPIGERVETGDLMAELVDIEADDPAKARTPITAATSGIFFARKADTLVRPGDWIGKIAGGEPLEDRKSGNLMSP